MSVKWPVTAAAAAIAVDCAACRVLLGKKNAAAVEVAAAAKIVDIGLKFSELADITRRLDELERSKKACYIKLQIAEASLTFVKKNEVNLKKTQEKLIEEKKNMERTIQSALPK